MHKIVREQSISFIVGADAFEAVAAPVSPVDVVFLEVLDEVGPGGVALVVAELSQEEGDALGPDEGLGVEQFLLELVVGVQAPGGNAPRPTVEMPSVDQLVGH